MAWARSEAGGHVGLRTSPMPRRYCSTSTWLTRRRLVAPAVVASATPRYWRPRAGTDTTPEPAGTAHRLRVEDGPGGAGGGAVAGGAGAVVVGLGGGPGGGGWGVGLVVVLVVVEPG